jgi:hypothetical protein
VNLLKKQMILIALVAILAGCDDNKGPVSFTPEMASFSNEFDFDPLRGPVKDFSQTLLNEKVRYRSASAARCPKKGVSIHWNCTIWKTTPGFHWY